MTDICMTASADVKALVKMQKTALMEAMYNGQK